MKQPNWHTTSNPRQFDVDITSIHWRPNFDDFPRHFHILFWCNFDGRKIHVASTYFYRSNFAGAKIHVASIYFFQCNLSGRNMHVIFTYFSRRNFDGQKPDIVFGKLSANENIGGGFSCVCNFKQLTCARLFYLNFSNKSPWCSPVSLKFKFYNLHHCKKNCCKLVFLVFTEQLLYQIIFVQLHCYEVTLVKMCNKLLPQKCETKVFNQKRLIKNLLKVSEKNNSGVSRINQIMYKLLILSKRLQFWTCQAFSHFTFHKPYEAFYYHWS